MKEPVGAVQRKRLSADWSGVRRISRQFDAVAEFYDLLPIGANSSSGIFVRAMPPDRRRILDVGCGTGSTLLALRGFFSQLYGVDVSPKMIEVAASKLPRGEGGLVLLAVADLNYLAFDNESFDYVISHTALHHVSDWCGALEQMKRVVHPGGRLVVADILRSRVTGYFPLQSSYLLSALTFIKKMCAGHFAAARDGWRNATNPLWMAHQRCDTFRTLAEIRAGVAEVLPGSTIRTFASESGLTSFYLVQWDKPEVS